MFRGNVKNRGQQQNLVVKICAKICNFEDMKQWQVLKTIFPEVIAENFEFVNYVESSDRLDYWLDERGYMSKEDYKKGTARGSMVLPKSVPSRTFLSEAKRSIYMSGDVNGVIQKTEASLPITTN